MGLSIATIDDVREAFREEIAEIQKYEFMRQYDGKYVSVSTVAEIYGITKATVIEYIKDKRIPVAPRYENAKYKIPLRFVLENSYKALKDWKNNSKSSS